MNSALRRRQERRDNLIWAAIAAVLFPAFVYLAGWAMDHPANKYPSREAWEQQQQLKGAK